MGKAWRNTQNNSEEGCLGFPWKGWDQLCIRAGISRCPETKQDFAIKIYFFLIFKLCVCVCICTCVFVQVRTKISEARKGGQIPLELELQVGVSHSIYIWMLGLNSQKWFSWADHWSVTVPKRYACTFPGIYYRHVAWRWKKNHIY